MSNTIRLALELSPTGEAVLQKKLLTQHDRAEIEKGLDPEEIYRTDGTVLRIWEKMDVSNDSPIYNFIHEVLEHIEPQHYRLIDISPHGDGQWDGDFEGPHNLRMVDMPEIGYDPTGLHVPASKPSPTVKISPPRALASILSSLLLAPEDLVEKKEFKSVGRIIKFGFSDGLDRFWKSQTILDYANRPENQGKRLQVRIMIHLATEGTVQPLASDEELNHAW